MSAVSVGTAEAGPSKILVDKDDETVSPAISPSEINGTGTGQSTAMRIFGKGTRDPATVFVNDDKKKAVIDQAITRPAPKKLTEEKTSFLRRSSLEPSPELDRTGSTDSGDLAVLSEKSPRNKISGEERFALLRKNSMRELGNCESGQRTEPSPTAKNGTVPGKLHDKIALFSNSNSKPLKPKAIPGTVSKNATANPAGSLGTAVSPSLDSVQESDDEVSDSAATLSPVIMTVEEGDAATADDLIAALTRDIETERLTTSRSPPTSLEAVATEKSPFTAHASATEVTVPIPSTSELATSESSTVENEDLNSATTAINSVVGTAVSLSRPANVRPQPISVVPEVFDNPVDLTQLLAASRSSESIVDSARLDCAVIPEIDMSPQTIKHGRPSLQHHNSLRLMHSESLGPVLKNCTLVDIAEGRLHSSEPLTTSFGTENINSVIGMVSSSAGSLSNNRDSGRIMFNDIHILPGHFISDPVIALHGKSLEYAFVIETEQLLYCEQEYSFLSHTSARIYFDLCDTSHVLFTADNMQGVTDKLQQFASQNGLTALHSLLYIIRPSSDTQGWEYTDPSISSPRESPRSSPRSSPRAGAGNSSSSEMDLLRYLQQNPKYVLKLTRRRLWLASYTKATEMQKPLKIKLYSFLRQQSHHFLLSGVVLAKAGDAQGGKSLIISHEGAVNVNAVLQLDRLVLSEVNTVKSADAVPSVLPSSGPNSIRRAESETISLVGSVVEMFHTSSYTNDSEVQSDQLADTPMYGVVIKYLVESDFGNATESKHKVLFFRELELFRQWASALRYASVLISPSLDYSPLLQEAICWNKLCQQNNKANTMNMFSDRRVPHGGSESIEFEQLGLFTYQSKSRVNSLTSDSSIEGKSVFSYHENGSVGVQMCVVLNCWNIEDSVPVYDDESFTESDTDAAEEGVGYTTPRPELSNEAMSNEVMDIQSVEDDDVDTVGESTRTSNMSGRLPPKVFSSSSRDSGQGGQDGVYRTPVSSSKKSRRYEELSDGLALGKSTSVRASPSISRVSFALGSGNTTSDPSSAVITHKRSLKLSKRVSMSGTNESSNDLHNASNGSLVVSSPRAPVISPFRVLSSRYIAPIRANADSSAEELVNTLTTCLTLPQLNVVHLFQLQVCRLQLSEWYRPTEGAEDVSVFMRASSSMPPNSLDPGASSKTIPEAGSSVVEVGTPKPKYLYSQCQQLAGNSRSVRLPADVASCCWDISSNDSNFRLYVAEQHASTSEIETVCANNNGGVINRIVPSVDIDFSLNQGSMTKQQGVLAKGTLHVSLKDIKFALESTRISHKTNTCIVRKGIPLFSTVVDPWAAEIKPVARLLLTIELKHIPCNAHNDSTSSLLSSFSRSTSGRVKFDGDGNNDSLNNIVAKLAPGLSPATLKERQDLATQELKDALIKALVDTEQKPGVETNSGTPTNIRTSNGDNVGSIGQSLRATAAMNEPSTTAKTVTAGVSRPVSDGVIQSPKSNKTVPTIGRSTSLDAGTPAGCGCIVS
jgi:hypothetical protein